MNFESAFLFSSGFFFFCIPYNLYELPLDYSSKKLTARPSTMVVTRHSTDLRTQPLIDPPRKRTKYTLEDIISQGINSTTCLNQVSACLLGTCFSRLRPEIWFTILPPRDENERDICYGTKQNWTNILSILIHTGILKKCDIKRTI